MTLLILADDLTGAADSAARCHHAGLPAYVYLAAAPGPFPAGAVALSTDSRYLSATAAAAQVRQVLTTLAAAQPVQWYKKIDSTLRGNIGAELEAMLAVLTPPGAQPCAVVCPAFPAQNRGLVDGYLVYAHAAKTIHLPTLFAQQTARPVAAISLDDVRTSCDHLATKLTEAQQQGAQLLVLDALDEADLLQVLMAAHQALPSAFFCGSAGLIEPLARAQATLALSPGVVDAAPVRLRRPIFAVSGSGSTTAHQQLARLRQLDDVRVIEVQYDRVPEIEQAAQPNHWVYHLPYPEQQVLLEGEIARDFVAHLTQMAAALIEQVQPGTLILVGGDTAVHLLHLLGITQLTVLCELMPGIPLLEGIDAHGIKRQIVTKAGNFGDAETLVQLFQRA
ncbi:MAG: four-carbon acid sugar kinase family protein [Chloroflexi bacterium]|nr:four-carbon acid sugar kinase family protein [Chloroflexota bacterium]